MMLRPVADYLVHFGSLVRFEAADGEKAQDEAELETACLNLPDEVPAEDRLVAIHAARDEGFAQGLSEARDEYEARLVQERQTFGEQLSAERERWLREESERLSKKIEAAFSEVESNIANSVARVLQPFIVDSLRGKMIDLLTENIGVLLGGKERPVIEIRGPKDLLAALHEKLPSLSSTIEYFPNDAVDVEIVAGQTKIETQIGAWIARIGSLGE
jgi:hypothetical protein